MFTTTYSDKEHSLTCIFPEKMDANFSIELSKIMSEKVDELLGTGKTSDSLKIIFDLKKTDYASSFFLRVVIMTANRVSKSNFTISNANQFIRDLFKTSGLEKFINISAPADEAQMYPPSAGFSSHAWLKNMDDYKLLYEHSVKNPDEFWDKMSKENIIWNTLYDKVSEWKEPHGRWFIGGTLNACYNCLDKHLYTIPDKPAIIWEGEPDEPNDAPAEVRKITYRELHHQVCKFSNVLKNNGIRCGDRVVIYMPMIPETIVAMLSCARIGAIHSVVFAGFSAEAIADRVADSSAKMIVVSDGVNRRGSILNLKKPVDEAMQLRKANGELKCASVKKIIVFKHASNAIHFNKETDSWWHEEIEKADNTCLPEFVDSEHQLFILYTSGSTGKPKGIIHTTGGYLLSTKLSHKYIFDIKDNDIYWCTADVGWITGHSYIVYGPLANGTTVFMYEGAPDYPDPGRFWKIIEKHKITVFYTAPTAIRSFMKWGDRWPDKYKLSSLRLLGSVGEPINPQAWLWYHKLIGNENCPIVDTWWQTETGAIMLSPLPGAFPAKPGSATLPFFGIVPDVIDEKGKTAADGVNGTFVIRKPWPSMLRGLWNDEERYKSTYWSQNKGVYTTGDTARRDKDGYYWIIGREDDVINVSGHRVGTAEVESALVSHHEVAEAAAVGRADDIKGTALIVFVTLKQGIKPSQDLADKLKKFTASKLGSVMKPDEIRFAEALPKTRSGKIMRRLLKQVAAGTEITGDITTLDDFNVIAKLSDE